MRQRLHFADAPPAGTRAPCTATNSTSTGDSVDVLAFRLLLGQCGGPDCSGIGVISGAPQ
jgi:hypothetical protein